MTDAHDAVDEKRELADNLDALADAVVDADSIADDAPVLSELFHAARTSRRDGHEGRYVALLTHHDDGWTCDSVAFLGSGTHYRDPNADAVLSFKPFPFLSVDEFGEHMAADLRRDARAARQNASQIEASRKEQERIEQEFSA